MRGRITELKKKILMIGPMHPGSISKQYNICGKARCKCKDPKNPVKHGPYYQLSYTVGGKNSTIFVRKSELKEARKQMKEYHEFRKLTIDLVKVYVDITRKEGFKRS